MSEATIPHADNSSLLSLFGTQDQHVRKLREHLRVDITHRDGAIRLSGNPQSVDQAKRALHEMQSILDARGQIESSEVREVLAQITGNPTEAGQIRLHHNDAIEVFAAGRQVRPRTPGQVRYLRAMRENDLVFAVGPSGTGKTYLAVAAAVSELKSEAIRKIVLVRPAVEAGESLGFLPGDLHAKINPYLRPLLDALYEMMDYDQVKRYLEHDIIEVIPLAYMRGRTLNEAFIILDEAQNTTTSQMKMFLTRMGHGSKIVVSGDTTQNDLPAHTRSGLSDALERLNQIDGFAHVQMSKDDIVRHRLVQDIVRAYEEGPDTRNRKG